MANQLKSNHLTTDESGKTQEESFGTSWLSNLFKKKAPRKEDRVHKALPVKVYGDNVKAVTRNFSLSGVYFETSSRYQIGSMIRMTIDFDSPQGMQLECEGTIVRVEGCGSDKMGVAVRMNNNNKILTLPKHESPSLDAGVFSRQPRLLNRLRQTAPASA